MLEANAPRMTARDADVDEVEGLDGCTPVDLAQLGCTPVWVRPYNLATENLRVDAGWVVADPALSAAMTLAGAPCPAWLNLCVVVQCSNTAKGCTPTARLVLDGAVDGGGFVDAHTVRLTSPRDDLARLADRSTAARLLTSLVDLTGPVAAAHAAALAEWTALSELQPLERAERLLATVCPRGRSRDVDEQLWVPMDAARADVDAGRLPMMSNYALARILMATLSWFTGTPLSLSTRRVLRTAAAPPVHHLAAYAAPEVWSQGRARQ